MKVDRIRFGTLIQALGLGIAILLTAETASAQWCGQPFPGGPVQPALPAPSAGCEPTECDKCTKSPCYVATGTYTTKADDLTIRTTGFPLWVGRSYESDRTVDGPLGVGWSSSLIGRLNLNTYAYSDSGYQLVADILMPGGARYLFTQNADGSFSAPPGRYDTLVQRDGSDGFGFYLTLQRSSSVIYFLTTGELRTMTDDYGNALQWSYDGSGRVMTVRDMAGSGRYLTVSWDGNNHMGSVADSSGRLIQYDATSGVLHTVTDAANRTTTYSYTQGRFAQRLSQITDNWNRIITAVNYDTADRVMSYTDAGETYNYAYSYNMDPTMTQKTDSEGDAWTYKFTAGQQLPPGLVTDTTDPMGLQTHTDYYSDGSVQRFVDVEQHQIQTYYRYTPNGSIASVERAYGTPSAVRFDYSYDSHFPSRVTAITPHNSDGSANYDWQGWEYEYYQVGDPAPGALKNVYRLENDGSTRDLLVSYVYDRHGRLTQQTSASGGVTQYAYHPNGDLWTRTSPSNGGNPPVTTYAYDSLGRVASVEEPLGHVTQFTYDALDRVTSVILPKTSKASLLSYVTNYSYDNPDGAGLLFTNMLDMNARTSKLGYDQYGHLVQSVDNAGATTTWGYNRGFRESLTDANRNVTMFSYDRSRRLSQVTFPDMAQEEYTYWGDGLLATKGYRNGYQIVYNYDDFRRLLTKDYPHNTQITYTYVGQKLTQVLDWPETHNFGYDSSYRLQSEAVPTRGTITYGYSAVHPGDDSVATYTVQPVQGGATTANYTYYPDGSLATINWSPVTQGAFTYTYSLAGRYDTITLPNNQYRKYTYDGQGRLTQISNVDQHSNNLATYAYGYDYDFSRGGGNVRRPGEGMLGQRTSMVATVPSQGLSNALFEYTYDANYQLLTATYPTGEVDSWTYDALGNRTSYQINQNPPQNYSYYQIGGNNWQRLRSDGVNNYSYDANGNMKTRAGYMFSYDYDNRLMQITGSGTGYYTYDYTGRRTSKQTSSTNSTYLYDGLNLVNEQGSTPADSADYLFGPGIDEPLAMFRNGQVYYYVRDGLGSVTEVTDSSGAVQASYLYDVWGQLVSRPPSLANPFTYTSREVGEANLMFYRARYYQPSIGRFISEDPKGLRSGDSSFYEYVTGSPVQFIDPMGHTRIYGNWCGPDWTGGYPEEYDPADAWKYLPPVNSVDAACRTHDICYYRCRATYPCNKKLRGGCLSICDEQLTEDLPWWNPWTYIIATGVETAHGEGLLPSAGENGGTACCVKNNGKGE